MAAMMIKQFTTEPLEVNCYVVSNDGLALVIDPGGSGPEILEYLVQHNLRVEAVINTHGHGDHIMANGFIVEATKAALYVHQQDAVYLTDPEQNLSTLMGEEVVGPTADGFLQDGDTIALGRSALVVLHTPGHTPGSICLLGEGVLFSGDTLFAGSQGRTDLPGGSERAMASSLERLAQLPADTIVYPGHGQTSTIGEERSTNPFLQGVLR